jgi:hypothetical protein
VQEYTVRELLLQVYAHDSSGKSESHDDCDSSSSSSGDSSSQSDEDEHTKKQTKSPLKKRRLESADETNIIGEN